MFRTLGILADAFLKFHSAKTFNWEGAPGENFFALSAYSFKTAMVGHKDAYTILCLSDGSLNGQSAVAAAEKTKEFGDSKVGLDRHARKNCFLWELSCGLSLSMVRGTDSSSWPQ